MVFIRIPPDFFIKKSIAELEQNILTLSEEQINNHLKKVYKLTQQEYFEIAILSKLLKRIQKKKEYYYHKQYPSYNWRSLLFKFLRQWFKPKYQDYKQYYEKYSFIEKKLQNKINNLHKKISR